MRDYSKIIQGASAKYGVPADLLTRLMQAESSGNARAVSPKGAQGLMQLMPGTAKELGVTDPFDPIQNINAGAAYLAQQYKRFGSWPTALVAYNAGPGRVEEAASWPGVRDYVSKVMGMQTVKQAATTAINDPQQGALLAQATAAAQKALADRNAMAKTLQGNIQETQALRQKMQEGREAPMPTPNLADIPAPPPAKPPANPLQVFGQIMPMMAVLGSGLSRGGALAAMKTATSAMKAVKDRDAQETAAAHDRWKADLNRVIAQNELEQNRYKAVMDNRQLSMNERVAELQVIAAENREQLALAAFQSGDVDMFTKLITLRQGALNQAVDLASKVEESDERRRAAALDRERAAPELMMAGITRRLQSGENLSDGDWRVLGMRASGSTADMINFLMLKRQWRGLTETEKADLEELQAMQARIDPLLRTQGAAGGARAGEETAATPGAQTEKQPWYAGLARAFGKADTGGTPLLPEEKAQLQQIRSSNPAGFRNAVEYLRSQGRDVSEFQ